MGGTLFGCRPSERAIDAGQAEAAAGAATILPTRMLLTQP